MPIRPFFQSLDDRNVAPFKRRLGKTVAEKAGKKQILRSAEENRSAQDDTALIEFTFGSQEKMTTSMRRREPRAADTARVLACR